jgi:hypothetical protein
VKAAHPRPCHEEALAEAGQKIWISKNILPRGAKFSEGYGKQKQYENKFHFSSRLLQFTPLNRFCSLLSQPPVGFGWVE